MKNGPAWMPVGGLRTGPTSVPADQPLYGKPIACDAPWPKGRHADCGRGVPPFAPKAGSRYRGNPALAACRRGTVPMDAGGRRAGVPERGCRLSNCAESASVMRTHCGIVARQPARAGAPGPTSVPADPLAPKGAPPLLRAGAAPYRSARARVDQLSGLNPGGRRVRAPGTRNGRSCRPRSRRPPGHGRPGRGRPRA